MRYFNNILLFLLLVQTYAFAQEKDTVTLKMFLPTGVRAGWDAVPYVRQQSSNTFKGFEAAIDVDLYRYYPVFEFGNSQRIYEADNGSTYQNDGTYWRAGIDVNFLKKDPEKNMFFIGARYGRSSFDEQASIVYTDPLWGDYNENFANNNLSASWFELTTGMKIKVWKIFWLGYTCRFKFSPNFKESQPLLTTDIPGYGTTDKPTTWGFSYYLLVKLPVRKVSK